VEASNSCDRTLIFIPPLLLSFSINLFALFPLYFCVSVFYCLFPPFSVWFLIAFPFSLPFCLYLFLSLVFSTPAGFISSLPQLAWD
jgi:hypothetical protein